LCKIICGNCGEVFDESKLKTVVEYRPYGETYAEEKYDVCPFCGENNISEAIQCPSCGEYYAGMEDFCEKCKPKVYTVENLEAFLTASGKWLEFLKWYFDDLEQLKILKDAYEQGYSNDKSGYLMDFCSEEEDLTEFLSNV
jgi:hypothetical protein